MENWVILSGDQAPGKNHKTCQQTFRFPESWNSFRHLSIQLSTLLLKKQSLSPLPALLQMMPLYFHYDLLLALPSPCRWSHLPWPCIKRKEVHTLLLCSFNSPEQRGKKCLARTKKWLVGTCEYLQQQRVRLPHSKEIHYKLFVRNVYTLVLQINSLCPKSAKILLTELNQ